MHHIKYRIWEVLAHRNRKSEMILGNKNFDFVIADCDIVIGGRRVIAINNGTHITTGKII